MLRNKFTFWSTILVLVLFPVLFLSGGGGDGSDDREIDYIDDEIEKDDPVQQKRTPIYEEIASFGGEFYAYIEARDFLQGIGMFYGVIKTYPAEGDWPGVETTRHDTIMSTDVRSLVVLRGVDVPFGMNATPDYSRPHASIKRETERFKAGMDFFWDMVKSQNCETLILSNPTQRENSVAIECDITVITLGNGYEMDLAKLLISAGHAMPDDKDYDFGAPIPRPH